MLLGIDEYGIENYITSTIIYFETDLKPNSLTSFFKLLLSSIYCP